MKFMATGKAGRDDYKPPQSSPRAETVFKESSRRAGTGKTVLVAIGRFTVFK
jgi:hypothetical protein